MKGILQTAWIAFIVFFVNHFPTLGSGSKIAKDPSIVGKIKGSFIKGRIFWDKSGDGIGYLVC
jgi:hypothetical protein